MINRATSNNMTVSITGETGTGKEMVAKAIHFQSARNKKPFIAINMSAIPADLAESELFGHEKGSFTGATSTRIGAFEQAQKGTLFLDEIGDLNLNLQAKLLRVLQEKEVKRIGSNEVISLDVRIIVATHKELLKEVKNKNFREDLYYRIAGIPIAILPLRERKEDIALLAEYFLHVFSKEHNRNSQSFSAESMEKLKTHAWPGNVRELKSVIELSAIMCDTEIITPEHLHFSTLQT
jgi:transcriptional regulator with GAF, ATPase, and Fis domain